MATVDSTNLDQTQLVKTPKLDKGLKNGRIKVLQDEYTFPADAFAANDEINSISLPKGAKIIDAEVMAPSLGTTGIFSMGLRASLDADGNTLAEDADSLVASADFGGAAARQRMGSAEAALDQKLGDEAQVFLTCTEVTTAAEDLVLKWKVYYVVD